MVTLFPFVLTYSGKKIFYAEFNDYDQSKIDDWLKENVIANLVYNDKETFYQNREKAVGNKKIQIFFSF